MAEPQPASLSEKLQHLRNTHLLAVIIIVLLLVYIIGGNIAKLWQWQQWQPQVTNQIKSQHLASELKVTLENLSNNPSNSELLKLYQSVANNLTQLVHLQIKLPAKLKVWPAKLKQQQNSITQYQQAANEVKVLLVQGAQQINTTINWLTPIVETKLSQKNLLFRQISGDRLTDRVTAARAKALANTVAELQQWQAAKQLLIQLQLELKLIAQNVLQSNVEQFDATLLKLEKSLLAPSANIETDLQTKLTEIDQFWLDGHHGLAKIRGLQTRYKTINQFFAPLRTQLEALQFQTNTIGKNSGESANIWQKLLTYQPPHVSEFTWQASLLGLLAVMFIWLLWIMTKPKAWYQQYYFGLQQQLVQPKTDASLPFLEQEAVLKQLEHITHPEHGELEYQTLKKQFNTSLMALIQQQRTGFWHSDIEFQPDYLEQLAKLCGAEGKINRWRALFASPQIIEIIAAAKQAKTTKETQMLLVKASNNESIMLSLTYQLHQWQVTLANYRHLDQLQQQIEQQQSDYKQQSQFWQQHVQQLIAAINQQNLLTQLRIQQLSRQNANDNRRLLLASANRHCQQLSQVVVSQSLLLTPKLAVTVSCKLNDVFAAIIQNAQLQQSYAKNQLSLSYQSELYFNCDMPVLAVQHLLEYLIQLMLTQQKGKQLALNLALNDVNKAQQVVNISLELNAAIKTSSAQQLQRWQQSLKTEQNNTDIITKQLTQLSALLHIDELQFQQQKQHTVLSINLPMTVSGKKWKVEKLQQYQQKNALVIGENALRNAWLVAHLSNIGLKVDQLKSAAAFCQQYSPKLLAKKPFSIIVNNDKQLLAATEQLEQHLASIAEQSRPKIVHLFGPEQKLSCEFSAYAFIDFPCEPKAFYQQIEACLQDEAKLLGQLLSLPDWLQIQPFQASQTAVLLAVTQPQKHNLLLRVLTALGLKPYVVTEQQTLNYYWQHGCFTLLITEMLPEYNSEVIESGNRQIWCLSAKLTSNDIKPLASLTELSQLITQLKPWLTVQPTPVNQTQNKASATVAKPSKAKVIKLGEREQKFQQALLASEVFDSLEPVIDLTQFAKNQGSAEMAGLMLADYIHSFTEDINHINGVGLSAEQKLQTAKKLFVTAKILAAEKLIIATNQLVEALQHNRDYQAKLQAVCEQFEQVQHYADVI